MDVVKKKLKKALGLIEKLKRDCSLENEVNKELARRNDVLKRDLSTTEDRLHSAKVTLANFEKSIAQLTDLTG